MALRIDTASQVRSQIHEPHTAQERSTIDFKKTLTQIQTNKNRELDEFLLRLENLGQKLVKSLSLTDLDEFRETVKNFLKSTFGQSSQLQEESCWDMQGRPKVLAKIKKINVALDELATQFIKDNPKPMELLAKIDQIRGLILDLFA